MPRAVTERCVMRCSHAMGRARPVSSRPFLRFDGAAALVIQDFAPLAISWCPNVGPTVAPCRTSLPPATGASAFVFVGGRPLALEHARGATDGVPPGATTWSLRDPGQEAAHVSG